MGRLTEAFKNFTKTDLTSMEGRVLLPHSFITQAAPDIRRKLQKLGKGPGTQFLIWWRRQIGSREEEARREQKEIRKDRRIERQTQALAQQQAKILALIRPATMREFRGEQGRKKDLNNPPQLSRNQCAYCREDGHWKRECPYRPKGRPMATRTPAPSVLILGDRD